MRRHLKAQCNLLKETFQVPEGCSGSREKLVSWEGRMGLKGTKHLIGKKRKTEKQGGVWDGYKSTSDNHLTMLPSYLQPCDASTQVNPCMLLHLSDSNLQPIASSWWNMSDDADILLRKFSLNIFHDYIKHLSYNTTFSWLNYSPVLLCYTGKNISKCIYNLCSVPLWTIAWIHTPKP